MGSVESTDAALVSWVQSLEGDLHQTIVAREVESGLVAGILSRAVRDVYLNGQAQSLGYISQMRIAPQYRTSPRAIIKMGATLEQLDRDGRAPFNLIVANILAQPLIELAPSIATALANGGQVVLSGLLTSQAPAVIEAYRAQGITLQKRIEGGDWSTLVMKG